MSTLNNVNILVVYDCSKQKPIGVFRTLSLCARYLKVGPGGADETTIHYSLKNKGRIQKSRFDFKVTVRMANDEFKKILGDKDFVIFDGYPASDSNIEALKRSFYDK